jgi:putative Holliday junction resolvase
MALDVGEKRVGIAISESGIFATPHSVLNRTSKKKDFARLQQLITQLNVKQIIVGMPYSLSGHEQIGPQAQRVMRYTEAMKEVIDLPVEYFDESYSTVDAVTQLTITGRKKIPIDAMAAAVILQNYLIQHGNEMEFKLWKI